MTMNDGVSYWIDNKKEQVKCTNINGNKATEYYNKCNGIKNSALLIRHGNYIGCNFKYKLYRVGPDLLIVYHAVKTYRECWERIVYKRVHEENV